MSLPVHITKAKWLRCTYREICRDRDESRLADEHDEWLRERVAETTAESARLYDLERRAVPSVTGLLTQALCFAREEDGSVEYTG